MILLRNRPIFIIFTLLAVLAFSGCSRQQTPADEPPIGVEEVSKIEEAAPFISAFEILQADSGELLAYVHGNHWDGALPFLQEGDDYEVNIRIESSAGEIIYPDNTTIFLSIQFMEGTEDIVSFDLDDDYLLLEGNQSGEARIFFSLEQDDEVIFQTPVLNVLVVEKVANSKPVETPEVYSYDLIDRSRDMVVADVHGPHWHGSIPPVTNGEYLSIGAVIKDTQGQIILLDGQPFSAAARIADQGVKDIVSFDFHDDHLLIIGVSPGDTMLVFMLLANDEPMFETPPIAVKVVN